MGNVVGQLKVRNISERTNVFDDRVQAILEEVGGRSQVWEQDSAPMKQGAETHHPSLLIWSPYPGVSTMLRRSLTPFSVMTEKKGVCSELAGERKGEGVAWAEESSDVHAFAEYDKTKRHDQYRSRSRCLLTFFDRASGGAWRACR